MATKGISTRLARTALFLVALGLCVAAPSGAVLNPVTRIRLFTATNYGGASITFKPLINTGSCQELPSTFAGKLRSGQFMWSMVGAASGVTVCDYVWFFTTNNCDFNDGSNKAVRIKTSPYNRNLASTTSIPNFANGFGVIQNARSFGCTFYPNPCIDTSVCAADQNSTCDPFPNFVVEDYRFDTTLTPKFPISNTGFQCVCKPGFVKVGGACRAKTELCAPLNCPTDATCEVSSTGAAACVCNNDDYSYSTAAGACVFTAVSVWLTEHNAARAEVGVPALLWNSSLTEKAHAWAQQLASSAGCMAVSKDPDTNASQNIMATTYYSDGASAVKEWHAEKDAVCTLPRDCIHYVRMVSPEVTSVGCGNASCSLTGGAASTTFVCFYSPFVG